MFALPAKGAKPSHIYLAFSPQWRDESSCANQAQKRKRNQYEQRTNQHSRHRRGTERDSRAGEGVLEERGQPEEGRAQGPENRQGWEKGPLEEIARAIRTKPVAKPRAESKGAKILALIGRPKGATLAEIMKTIAWQAHSVRGFLSTAAKKHGLKIESLKNEAGERCYSIRK